MGIAESLISAGGWASLALGSLVRFIWLRRPSQAANWLFSLGVLLLYASWFLIFQPVELGFGDNWAFGLSRIGATTVLVLGGLFLCWRASSKTAKTSGVLAIVAGFAVIYPGALFPVEYTG